MLAQELQAGDEYRTHLDGTVEITVIQDAKPDGINPLTGKTQVCAIVRFRDGGLAPRWFDADDDVDYIRPEK